MKLSLFWITAAVVFCFGALFRFYSLNTIPPALNWDETAIGWNAYSLWKVRLDEYGTHLPWAFRSFGDYKAPFLPYATAPFVGLLGLTPWVVRLPVVLAATATMGVFFLLAWEFFSRIRITQAYAKWLALISMTTLAFSPWHIYFSRGAYETTVALFWVVTGIWLLLLGLRYPWVWAGSAICFILSLYTYHSTKIFVPLFLVGALVVLTKLWWPIRHKIWLVVFFCLVISVAGVWPVARDSFYGEAATRAKGTSIFFEADDVPRPINLELMGTLVSQWAHHFQPQFYLFGSTKNDRIGLRDYGLLPQPVWGLYMIGLLWAMVAIWKTSDMTSRAMIELILVWLGLAFIPPAVGREVPHPLRSLNALPAIILLATYGGWQVGQKLKEIKKVRWAVLGGLVVWLILDFSQFSREYFSRFPIYAAKDWQFGYKEVSAITSEYENSVDKILITSNYGQPYIFTLFFQRRDPQMVLWGAMSKYLYRTINWDSDQFESNTLLIGTAEELPKQISSDKGDWLKDIRFPDGDVAFRVVKTK